MKQDKHKKSAMAFIDRLEETTDIKSAWNEDLIDSPSLPVKSSSIHQNLEGKLPGTLGLEIKSVSKSQSIKKVSKWKVAKEAVASSIHQEEKPLASLFKELGKKGHLSDIINLIGNIGELTCSTQAEVHQGPQGRR